ncbi:hypothetical protein KP509_37G036200 [Ceratopteris richardii]|uniref:Glycosyl transferase family 28 C-terminal domain-containing protein n=2 Tax=Ceratopteris richardii TaxID=49495 RepID=A0A8T2Q7L4_CERRI|nr:hypothetical protein KP509_37G036200 [Ceratopteris richardii]KAH7279776.1 hypothetical protein KP509_37G036200 [Ceratopteris richardii]
MGRKVFVTVGTTRFDALIKAVDTRACKAAIASHGYSSMVLQIGHGSYLPTKDDGDSLVEVNFFTFAADLKEHLKSADLVISHAGSGSIFETLRMGKPLIVVVNEALMDNHQAELAEELAAQGYLMYAFPSTLEDVITKMNLNLLVPYEPSDASAVVTSLSSFLGFHN